MEYRFRRRGHETCDPPIDKDVDQIVAEKRSIGKYEIVSELGRGGMGVVYKAWEESLQRFVAIKMLGDQLTHDATVVQRFLREARAVADLNHPNVVQVFAVDTHEGRPYFAMEYVEGESLTELIQTARRVDPKRAVQLLKETAAGLAAAHAKGVVHRDIKPDNIMLTKHGGVKVVDFGVAKIDDPDTRLTATGMAVGTPNYISPEVCLGKEVDARSDLFSLGIVFYEMLAGESPFKADSPIAMMSAVVNSEVPDITTLNSAVDENIRLILGQMLQKNPARRYQGCQALVEDLESYIAGQPPAHAVAAVNDATLQMPVPANLQSATTQTAPILAGQGQQTDASGGVGRVGWAVALLLILSAGAAGGYYYQQSDDAAQPLASSSENKQIVEPVADLPVDPSVDVATTDGLEAQPEQNERVAQSTSVQPVETEVSSPAEAVAIVSLPVPNIATPPPAAVQAAGPPKVVVIARGDPAVSTVIESVLENALIAADFTVMDEQFFDGLNLGELNIDLARLSSNVLANGADILVYADIRHAGERKLTFYGRTEFQKTASMQIRVLSLADKRSLGAPWVGSLEYVPLNASAQARDAAEPIAQELVTRLQTVY